MFSRFNKGLMIVMVLIALSAVIYAFAASGTITPAITASYGTKDATAYTVSGKTMTTSGAYVSSILLNIAGATTPTSVAISTNTTTNYADYNCGTITVVTANASYTASCTPVGGANSITVLSVAKLEAVIHD